MRDLKNQHVSCPYEVGDGFFTKNSTNPEARWPGTKWLQIKDMFILAAGDNYEVDETGGEESHVLVPKELPDRAVFSINNNTGKAVAVSGSSWSGGLSVNNYYYVATCNHDAITDGLNTDYTLENQPHNNMPPYLVRYYWERTA